MSGPLEPTENVPPKNAAQLREFERAHDLQVCAGKVRCGAIQRTKDIVAPTQTHCDMRRRSLNHNQPEDGERPHSSRRTPKPICCAPVTPRKKRPRAIRRRQDLSERCSRCRDLEGGSETAFAQDRSNISFKDRAVTLRHRVRAAPQGTRWKDAQTVYKTQERPRDSDAKRERYGPTKMEQDRLGWRRMST